MNSTYFANKKSLQIISQQIKDDIKSEIDKIGSFNLNSKYYTFLNKKNVNNLKESDFLVSLSTFGKKFILFITTYNKMKYCIFINKKNDTMTITQLKFNDYIFNGTLFDGELVKNSNNKWIFLINDIAYYKGNSVITSSFKDRCNIIKNILENEYNNDDDITNQTFFISQKQYFEYTNIKDMVEVYMNKLNYKCSGIYFKSVNNFSDNYLFIFPECRSDSKILNNGITIDNQKVNILVKEQATEEIEETDENYLFKDIDIIDKDSDSNTINKDNIKKVSAIDSICALDIKKSNIEVKQEQQIEQKFEQKNIFLKDNSNIILDKKTCRFLIHGTPMPDIYELYCKNSTNHIEKYSYASVPDIKTSDFLKNIMINDLNIDINTKIESGKAIYVDCNYHKGFKKWIPFKKVDSMDDINIINQTQIILDSQ